MGVDPGKIAMNPDPTLSPSITLEICDFEFIKTESHSPPTTLIFIGMPSHEARIFTEQELIQ